MKPKLVALALALLLAASAALNVLFLRQGEEYYRQLSAVTLDPLGLEVYPDSAAESTPGHADSRLVVFFGDSRAGDWPIPAGLEGVQFVNRGIYGQTSAQALGRFDAHVIPLRPDAIVVQIGINDLKTIPLFPDQKASIVGRCKENIAAIVSRSAATGATVIVTTIFPLGQVPLERRLFWSSDVAQAVEDVNAAIRTTHGEHVVVFDAASVLAGTNGQARWEYSRDLLHLSGAGYEALNGELEPLLEATLR